MAIAKGLCQAPAAKLHASTALVLSSAILAPHGITASIAQAEEPRCPHLGHVRRPRDGEDEQRLRCIAPPSFYAIYHAAERQSTPARAPAFGAAHQLLEVPPREGITWTLFSGVVAE